MGNAIAESPVLPYKDRGGWLIAFGVIEILLGALSLLMGTFILIASLSFKHSHTAEMPVGIHTAGLLLSVGVYVVIAAYFLIAGIGSIQRRNWGRILTLIGSVVWLAVGTLGTLFFLFLLPKIMAVQHAVPPGAQHIERIVMGTVVLMAIVFCILLPLTFLIFYSRKSVKVTCLAREVAPSAAETPSRKLPVPVILLVVWEALGAVTVLSTFFLPLHATILFGYVVRGWKAVAILLAFSALSAIAAWLIYKLNHAGWVIALLKLLFFGASALVSLASSSMSRLFVEMGPASGQEQFAQLFPHFMTFIMGASLVVCAAYLALLIYSRKYFLPVTLSATS
jgi:hypothetical protein